MVFTLQLKYFVLNRRLDWPIYSDAGNQKTGAKIVLFRQIWYSDPAYRKQIITLSGVSLFMSKVLLKTLMERSRASLSFISPSLYSWKTNNQSSKLDWVGSALCLLIVSADCGFRAKHKKTITLKCEKFVFITCLSMDTAALELLPMQVAFHPV